MVDDPYPLCPVPPSPSPPFKGFAGATTGEELDPPVEVAGATATCLNISISHYSTPRALDISSQHHSQHADALPGVTHVSFNPLPHALNNGFDLRMRDGHRNVVYCSMLYVSCQACCLIFEERLCS